jgi:hypothetical protein
MRSRHKSEAFITTQEHCSVVVAPLTKQTEHEVLPQDLSLGGQDLPVRCTNRATMHMMTAPGNHHGAIFLCSDHSSSFLVSLTRCTNAPRRPLCLDSPQNSWTAFGLTWLSWIFVVSSTGTCSFAKYDLYYYGDISYGLFCVKDDYGNKVRFSHWLRRLRLLIIFSFLSSSSLHDHAVYNVPRPGTRTLPGR